MDNKKVLRRVLVPALVVGTLVVGSVRPASAEPCPEDGGLLGQGIGVVEFPPGSGDYVACI